MALCLEGKTPRGPRAAPDSLVVRGADADTYVARLIGALRAARLNAFFTPEAALTRHLSFLGPAGSAGLYPALHLALQNGLPSAREVLRVKIDRELAAGFLADTARRAAPPAPGSRLARRIAYYARLLEGPVLPAERLTVELRSQLVADGVACFRVVLDRFDLAASQFVRYTILLAQQDRGFRQRQVVVDEDLAAPTEGFRRAVGRFTSHEAEVAFILLSRLRGITVEDVRRCRVGPLLLPGARVGAALEALLDPAGRAARGAPPWILCLPEDRAGIAVAANAGRDPLAPLMRDAVGEESRALIDAKAEELGYRVAKSRKFVCPAPLVEPLQRLCRELDAPSVVRGVE